MAVIYLLDGGKQTVTAEQGEMIWKVFNGEIEPTDEQLEFVTRVDRVFLNWRKAPNSYIEAHFDLLIDSFLSEWVGDIHGNPVKPEPKNKRAWEIAKKFGLWENGSPTFVVINRYKSITLTSNPFPGNKEYPA